MGRSNRINRLLYELRQLYHRLCAIDLRTRMGLYHRHIGANHIPDISSSLSGEIDELAQASKMNTHHVAGSPANTETNNTGHHKTLHQPETQHHGIFRSAKAFFHGKKIFTTMKSSDPRLGEKLKESTWSHIHTARLQARQGNISNAKLHASIAQEALNEAAHYISEDDYEVLCKEVVEVCNNINCR